MFESLSENLMIEWIEAKAAEKAATDKRREVEDQIMASYEPAGEIKEGVISSEVGPFKLKVTQRMNRKIDSDALQEIASEYGLTDHLGALFRWKPEINARAWKDAGEEITKPLLDAITTKPGRPSINIETIATEDK